MDENIVQSTQKLVLASQTPQASGASEPFLVLPHGHEVHSIIELLDSPRRIKDRLLFGRLDSFCAYVKEFKLAGTKIFLNALTGAAKAVLDFHTVGTAAWCDHTAEYQPLMSEEWKRWQARNNQSFDQRSFALFLEDNAPDISSPKAAEILDVARTLTAKLSVNFKKGVRLDNGTEQLTYEESVEAKAGQKGDLEIPTSFELLIPVFEGREPRRLGARLRYTISGGVLTFHYGLVRPHKVFQEEIDAINTAIGIGTDIKPLYGVDA